MSWIFGFSGSLSEQKKLSLSTIFPVPDFKIDEPRLFITAGGPEYTINFSEENRWIMLGVGISGTQSRKLLLKEDWDGIVKKDAYRDPEGHYVMIRWNNDEINFYSDPIGLRTIYFYKHKTGIYFSSKLDWLTAVMDRVEIDFKEFGSRWMLFNQLSNTSFIYEIEKLPPASIAVIKNGSVKIQTDTWMPSLNYSEPEYLFQIIKKYLTIKLPDELKLTLGLSGGLDSRFLLSFLLQNDRQQFNIHSCGYNDDADLRIAKKISDELALKCYFLQPDIIGSGQLFNKAREYAAAVQLSEPVSSFLQFSVFNDKYFNGKFLVDGALAEFARRQFLNRLLIKGKKALLNKKHTEVIKHLIVPKPDIFKKEYNEMMLEYSAVQMKNIFEQFPDPGETGAENFVDLFIFKFRIPNYFGPEQARLDNLLPGFMPFAQKNTIAASLGIPVKLRVNSRLFYNAINRNYPALEDFPLVKSSVVYPYGLSSLTSYAYTRIKKSVKNNTENSTVVNFFMNYEKSVREFITRDRVREYVPYNEEAVIKIINDFYSRKNKNIIDLDWLLTFEMFRRNLNITGT